ncbi:lyase family protein [Micromonospora sp. CPCC 205539]|uniref:argininosuccinate lyase n=1 Tax=Micromonospora sp. CPCC 205539 TaxID=3122408 RepID=UPI002FEF5419
MNSTAPSGLTGRIDEPPGRLLHDEVLAPQFRFEVEHLLPSYVAVEKVLALEYQRMGLLTADQARAVATGLASAGPEALTADPVANLSDLAFALERHVEATLTEPLPRWHVDRSRNDLQAAAQLMYGRQQVVEVAQGLLRLGVSLHRRAGEHLSTPMPGYTHFQAAQVITPGFHFAAFSGHVLHTLRRLLATYDAIDACPLGAGAMAGQDLPWDRARMARLLGFRVAQPHALTAVASRRWVLEVTAELSLFGAETSRFVTDLLAWGGSDLGFLDLPDELSGISSAMPQKKNFPILERIRGRSAHLGAFHTDALLGQRNTPYSNLVEVSKEAGTHLHAAIGAARSLLRLLTAVVDNLRFRTDRMLAACEREYLGGFALANLLTLREGVPWRRAQVLAGRYVVAAAATGRAPKDTDPELLAATTAAEGYRLVEPATLLREAFDVHAGLTARQTSGSARPSAVADLLAAQTLEYDELRAHWTRRAGADRVAAEETDRLLGLVPADAGLGLG